MYIYLLYLYMRNFKMSGHLQDIGQVYFKSVFNKKIHYSLKYFLFMVAVLKKIPENNLQS